MDALTTRRRLLRGILIGASLAAFGGSGLAQDAYPTKPIVLVVPHAAGGPVDAVGRFLAEKMAAELGQHVVVENRAGASSMIGAAQVAAAAPDGYTLYINASIHSINPLLYRKTMKYDAVKDFTPIGMLAQGPLLFVVGPQVKATSAREFAAMVKADPAKFTFATGGFGAADHLASAYFLYEIGQPGIPIALYKGGAPALSDLMGGQVSAKMDAILTSMPLVKANKLHALAITGRERSPLLPDVPTMREAGFKDFEFYTWYGLWAPANLPAPIRQKLESTVQRIVATSAWKERMSAQGFEAVYRNSADFAKFIDSEVARYQTIVTAANIKAE
ncbi:MAG: tripartite tricarboxylate transporter substrate binding protein [Betaproteobacteria bacterium PRO3]|nr:tripartite tricarboxylate transporter substrate binding protein [Betaproteobacteria bacterium PRO3]